MEVPTQQPERRRPLTVEQIEMIADCTEHAARKALRIYVSGAVVGFMVLLLGVAFAVSASSHLNQEARNAIVQSGQVIAVDGCNRDYRERRQVRQVLIASRRDTRARYRRDELTRANYIDRLTFFREQLAGLPLPDCRQARNILTSDPDEVVSVPDPLYPGKPK